MNKKKENQWKEKFLLNFSKAYKKNDFNIKDTCAELGVHYLKYLNFKKNNMFFSTMVDKLMKDTKNDKEFFSELSKNDKIINTMSHEKKAEIIKYKNEFFGEKEIYTKIFQNLFKQSEKSPKAIECIFKYVYHFTPIDALNNYNNEEDRSRVTIYELPKKE